MESGAQAAISGYRRQALYTANLLIQTSWEDYVFQPEGKEDLAIYIDKKLVQAVQVKAYSSLLSLSTLEPNKPDSFFRRIIALEASATVELASFGPLGPELMGVQNGNQNKLASVTEKLRKHGYTNHEVEQILSRLSIVKVDEEVIQKNVFDFLTKTVTAGNPERAFDLVVWWLLEASEKQLRITPQQFRDRLQAIGQYLTEREAHHQEWFSTIKPLEDKIDPRGLSLNQLEQEYYQGVAARYSHIRVGLDIRRDAPLQAIDTEFQKRKKVVILHGASGQGKTSLALRYLHEYAPEGWRFLVTSIDSRQHAARIANAFADHLYALKLPLYILIDVAPRDLGWVTLVRNLLDYEQIRILVAIREEDLARQTSAPHELSFPADILLEFGPAEAESIYDSLAKRKEASNVFPTFKESWDRFGGEGPLLEFVYLLTQTQSLRSVLTAQVHRIREEIRAGTLQPQVLQLLHLCAVATAFEARIFLRPLVKHLQLTDPSGTIGLLEKEYLLRVTSDGATIEALHPFRSAFLADIMSDPTFSSTVETIIDVRPFIHQEDLEIFLLYAFSRQPDCWERLYDDLKSCRLATWSVAAGVCRALIWWGIRAYLIENKNILDQYSLLFGGLNNLLPILPDLAGASASDPLENIFEYFGGKNNPLVEKIQDLRNNFTNRERVFIPLRKWLNGLEVDAQPVSPQDWESIGELIFWAGYLGMQPPTSLKLADVPIEKLPIETVAKICFALANNDPDGYAEAHTDQEKKLRKLFQEQTNTPLLADGENSITAHFIVESNTIFPELFSHGEHGAGVQGIKSSNSQQNLSIQNRGDQELTSKLNQEAVWRASLLHSLFPNRSRCCTQGYGHQLGIVGLELPYDDTHKKMPASAIPARWLVRLNSISNNLWINQRRPENWRQYAEIILKKREITALALLKLKRSLSGYFKKNKPRSLISGQLPENIWQEARAALNEIPNIPRSSVDEWGLSSETQQNQNNEREILSTSIATAALMLANRPLSSALREYFIALEFFFQQSEIICRSHGYTGRQPEKKGEFLKIAEKAGYSEDQIRLSKVNLFSVMQRLEEMQQAFDNRLGSLLKNEKLQEVKQRERHLFPQLWALWYQFCHHPEKHFVNAEVQATSEFEAARDDLLNTLRKTLPAEKGWSASVMRATYTWKGKQALVIRLEMASIILLMEAKERLFAALEEALSGLDYVSLHANAFEYYFHYILVIPTINGCVLGSGTWVLPYTSFYRLSNERLIERNWLKPLHPLNSIQIQELELKEGNIGSINGIDTILKTSSHLQLIFSHLASFSRLAEKLDEQGLQILSNYFAELAPKLNDLLSSFQGIVPNFCLSLRNKESLTEQEKATYEEVASTFEDTLESLKEFSEGKIHLTLADCNRWAEEFENLANLAGIVGCLS